MRAVKLDSDAARPGGQPPRSASPALRLWSFLWSAGSSRLPLSVDGRPAPHGRSVQALSELLALAEGGAAGGELVAVIERLLDEGLLERWLGEALGLAELSAATAALRSDGKPLRARRWLTRAGAPSRFRLPLRSGVVLEAIEELPSLLDRPGGREALHAALADGSLETWVDGLRPGTGAAFAEARALDPEVAVDRAVRLAVDDGLRVAPGTSVRDYNELRMRTMQGVGAELAFAGDAGARARVRDALLGPRRLPGAPADLVDIGEAELAAFPPSLRSFVFGWALLRLPFLPLAGRMVRSAEELVAAIAEPAPRALAEGYAAKGVLSAWAARALGRSLPEALRGKVPAQDFPSLCAELGEPPPAIEARFGNLELRPQPGETARFELHLANLDPVRSTALDLRATIAPSAGRRLAFPSRVALAPGERLTVSLTLEGDEAVRGASDVFVSIGRAHPSGPRRIGAPQRLLVRPRRPLRALALALTGAVALSLLAGMLIATAHWMRLRRHPHRYAASAPLVEHHLPPHLQKTRREERAPHTRSAARPPADDRLADPTSDDPR